MNVKVFGQQPAIYHLFGYETQTEPIKYKTINVQCLVKIGKQTLEYLKLSSAEILYVAYVNIGLQIWDDPQKTIKNVFWILFQLANMVRFWMHYKNIQTTNNVHF